MLIKTEKIKNLKAFLIVKAAFIKITFFFVLLFHMNDQSLISQTFTFKINKVFTQS